jgi:hypothetical protein
LFKSVHRPTRDREAIRTSGPGWTGMCTYLAPAAWEGFWRRREHAEHADGAPVWQKAGAA